MRRQWRGGSARVPRAVEDLMSRALPGPEEIERLLASDSARPYRTVREIAADLGLSAGRRPALRRLVGRLVDEGRLVAVRGRRFGTRKVLGDVVGRFTRPRSSRPARWTAPCMVTSSPRVSST